MSLKAKSISRDSPFKETVILLRIVKICFFRAALDNLNTFSDDVRKNFEATLGWLQVRYVQKQ
jgi:hypothetical protein